MSNIIITGANEGIGYFLVEQLLKDGNNVAVLDLRTDNLEHWGETYRGQLLYYMVDMRNQDAVNVAVKAAVLAFGVVDIAIHNACKCTFESEEATDIDVYRDVFDVNYFGALYLSKSVLPYMKKQNSGKIIFTSSGVGVTGFMNISPYASTKGAIESLAKCLKIEYARHGISFHLFHPPLTRTTSSAGLPVPKEFMATPEKVGRNLAKHIRSKRFIICHSFGQKLQTIFCYLFPLKLGSLMSKMTAKCEASAKNV